MTLQNYKILDNKDIPLNEFDLAQYEARESDVVESVYYKHRYTGYRGIVYTPIDVPYLDIDQDKLWRLWQQNVADTKVRVKNKYPDNEIKQTEEIMRNGAEPWFDDPDVEGKTAHIPFNWKHRSGDVGRLTMDYRQWHLMEPGNFHGYSFQGTWSKVLLEEFPEIAQHVDEYLPFESVRYCSVVGRDIHGVGPHYDDLHAFLPNMKSQDPAAIRIRLGKTMEWDNRDNVDWSREHFYLTNTHGRRRLYPLKPPSTNTIAYDATTNEHGGDKGYTPNVRCQIMPYGVLDVDKWHALLDKSVERYSDYVIYQKDMDAML